MTKTEFTKVINKAKRIIENPNDTNFSCIAISMACRSMRSDSEYSIACPLRSIYADFFGVTDSDQTFYGLLPDFNNEQVNSTRLAALELFKEIMLTSGEYQGIEL